MDWSRIGGLFVDGFLWGLGCGVALGLVLMLGLRWIGS